MSQTFVFRYNYDLTREMYATSTSIPCSSAKDVCITLKGEHNVEQLLHEFMDFMKACGYSFNIGEYIDVCNDIEDESENSSYDQYLKEKEDKQEEEDWNNSFVVAPEDRVEPDSSLSENLYEDKYAVLKDEILPFLENLKGDPEKVMIRWPNRSEVVQKKIDAINKILGE